MTAMSNIVHQNKNYKIEVRENKEGLLEYALINKQTGVVESATFNLPHAIGDAEQSNAYLDLHMWDWIAAQAVRSRQEIDKEMASEQFPVEDIILQ